MKKYESIWRMDIEKKIKEGKNVYIYDKKTFTTYNAMNITLKQYIDLNDDEDDRFVVWVCNDDIEVTEE